MLRTCLSALVLSAACGSPAKPVAPPSNTGASGAPPAFAGLAFTALVPVGKECALERLPLTGPAEVIAMLPSACRGGRIAFTWDAARCVVWFDPDLATNDRHDASGQLFEVTLATKAVRPLPPFPGPDPAQLIAFTADDQLFGFTTHDLDLAGSASKVVYLGTQLDFTTLGDGIPAAAVSYRFVQGAWSLAGVDRTTDGWDYAQTWSASRFAQRLGSETSEYLAPYVETQQVDLDLAAAIAKLPTSKTAQRNSDTWQRLPTGRAHRVFGYFITGEIPYSTGLLAWETSPGHVELMPQLTGDGEQPVSLHALGTEREAHRYLFVATARAGERARLYDLVDHTVIFATDEALAVIPWPAPASPPRPETDEGIPASGMP